MSIDLRTCKEGDTLISNQGAKLEYVSPTPWKHYTYLDHVVKYVEDKNGNSFGDANYGTRTHDGFTYAKNRIPEVDHDVYLKIEGTYVSYHKTEFYDGYGFEVKPQKRQLQYTNNKNKWKI